MAWDILKGVGGAKEGGTLRVAVDQLLSRLGISIGRRHTPVECQAAFTIAVVTLAAKMSKADGVSSTIEAETFERVFSVPASERENLRRVFALASQDVAGFESYANRIAELLSDEPELKISVLESLFHIASADGILHPDEDAFLKIVAARFGLPETEFKAVRRAFIADPDDPYEVLGISPRENDEAIKQHYRRLVREHHPDGLLARGVPPEFLAAADRRLAAINAAYEAILAERGRSVAQVLERTS